MPFQSRSRISDLLLEQGNNRANIELQKGQAWSNAAQNIGNITSRTIGSLLDYKSDEPTRKLRTMQAENAGLQNTALKREAEGSAKERAIIPFALKQGENGIATYDRDLLTREFTAAGIGDRLPEVFKGLDAADQAALAVTQAKQEAFAGLAYGVMSAGNTPEAFKLALDYAKTNGLASPQELSQIIQSVGSDPNKIAEITKSIASRSKTFAPMMKPIEVSPGASLVSPLTGETTMTAPNPAQEETARHNTAMEDISRMTAGRQEAAQQETARHNAAMESTARQSGVPLEAVTGADGKSVLVPRADAVGMTPAARRERPSEDSLKMAGFYKQMQQSIKIIDEVESQLTSKDLYQIQTLPQEQLIGMANRGEMSEAAKRYLRAFEQFTEARLRPVSGAAITDGEYARDRRTYAKQYGETPKLSEERKAARELASDALKTRAGSVLQDGAAPTSMPDLSGLQQGHGRTFNDGPFKGQTWTLGPDGKPERVQ